MRLLLPYLVAMAVFVFGGSALFERYIILATQVNGSYKVNRIIENQDPDEIPILGNSRAEAHYVPSAIHPQSFNYGLSGTGEDVLLFFLKEEMKKSRSTPILVNLDLEGLDSSIGNPANYLLNASKPAVKELLGVRYSWIYAVPMLKYFNQFDLFFGMWLNDRSNFSGHNDRGAVLRYEKMDPQALQDHLDKRAKGINTHRPSPTLEAALMDLLRAHPERRVIFVISPYHEGIFNRFPNLDEAQALLARLDSLPNAEVLDFSHAGYPDSLYNNSTHLAYAGALRLSEELRDSLHKRIGAPF
jgi:hypothetical protein